MPAKKKTDADQGFKPIEVTVGPTTPPAVTEVAAPGVDIPLEPQSAAQPKKES